MQETFQQIYELMSQGKPEFAEEKIRLILSSNPEDYECLRLLGQSLLAQKKLNDAIDVFQQIVSKYPQLQIAKVELAKAYIKTNNLQLAEKLLTDSLNHNPEQSELWHCLGNLFMEKGDRVNAKQYFANAYVNDPLKDLAKQSLDLLNKRELVTAEKLCRQVLSKNKNHTIALTVLARIAAQSGAVEQAIIIINQSLNYSPYNINFLQLLFQLYSDLAQFDKAIEVAEKLTDIEPENADFWSMLASKLLLLGNYEESISAYQKALTIDPEMCSLYLSLGYAYRFTGNRIDSEKSFLKPIELKKLQGTAYWALADLKTYQFSQKQINELTAFVENSHQDISQRCQAGFALAKACEDNKNYKQAFDYYAKANKLRADVKFQPAVYQKICVELCELYDQEILENQAIKRNCPIPIFIVGLPRSGSTLIEQILASHSQVEGTMELLNMHVIISTINRQGLQQFNKSYPQSIAYFSQQELTSFGNRYLQDTAIVRQGKDYFIDKLPLNYMQVGLIHKILPEAIIIDARRHPMSCGFSAFKQYFGSGYNFSYDLENIAAYYNSYLTVMDHWDKVLPGKVLKVQYEDVIDDAEAEIRKIINHCGLEFEQQCIKFYDNKRTVITASSEQVRQPIYKDGLQQWHHFEQYLRPLKQALGEKTLARFL